MRSKLIFATWFGSTRAARLQRSRQMQGGAALAHSQCGGAGQPGFNMGHERHMNRPGHEREQQEAAVQPK